MYLPSIIVKPGEITVCVGVLCQFPTGSERTQMAATLTFPSSGFQSGVGSGRRGFLGGSPSRVTSLPPAWRAHGARGYHRISAAETTPAPVERSGPRPRAWPTCDRPEGRSWREAHVLPARRLPRGAQTRPGPLRPCRGVVPMLREPGTGSLVEIRVHWRLSARVASARGDGPELGRTGGSLDPPGCRNALSGPSRREGEGAGDRTGARRPVSTLPRRPQRRGRALGRARGGVRGRNSSQRGAGERREGEEEASGPQLGPSARPFPALRPGVGPTRPCTRRPSPLPRRTQAGGRRSVPTRAGSRPKHFPFPPAPPPHPPLPRLPPFASTGRERVTSELPSPTSRDSRHSRGRGRPSL